ncbi:MAG: tRNA (N6-threonylcarbamoyladenosine(37)-N6)-methyltransferase TrmO [Bdellovibrionales bacterium]|nr:tRNA (N6-threonylcarbamoyladenosine(37)-N6)-methyltransferase TrmO [Bdellovibrionales bacterium]
MQKKTAKKSAYPGKDYVPRSGPPSKKPPPPTYEFAPIGVIRTAFAEKFGIPRQPGMVAEAKGVIELDRHPFFAIAVDKLETFSHLWVLFVFHEHGARDWKPSIRPPRLGGRKKVGVLASRSPHRPNPIGLSAVKLDRIEKTPKGVRIHVSGVDLLDGTPILDVKPYIPFADSIADANAGWAAEPIEKFPVEFTEKSLASLDRHERRIRAQKNDDSIDVRRMIVEMLELDPRPASQKRKMPPREDDSKGLRFAFTLFDFDVKWEIRENAFAVLDLEDLVDGRPAGLAKKKSAT